MARPPPLMRKGAPSRQRPRLDSDPVSTAIGGSLLAEVRAPFALCCALVGPRFTGRQGDRELRGSGLVSFSSCTLVGPSGNVKRSRARTSCGSRSREPFTFPSEGEISDPLSIVIAHVARSPSFAPRPSGERAHRASSPRHDDECPAAGCTRRLGTTFRRLCSVHVPQSARTLERQTVCSRRLSTDFRRIASSLLLRIPQYPSSSLLALLGTRRKYSVRKPFVALVPVRNELAGGEGGSNLRAKRPKAFCTWRRGSRLEQRQDRLPPSRLPFPLSPCKSRPALVRATARAACDRLCVGAL